jgi:signal transduction histidine kinase
MGANFRLAPATTSGGQKPIYQVFSQVAGERAEAPAYVNLYRDVAAQLRLESQILESAKMAELGTIGSSIAHELNNPLGGMLSFLQLIKMDLKGSEPWAKDVEEMEMGAKRCRDIVQNLLGFARKSSPEGEGEGDVDMREVASQALKIAELQTRAMGVAMRVSLPDAPAIARGQFNLLAQAMRFFLQAAQEAIAARARREGPARFRGEISLSLSLLEKSILIEIADNGWREDAAGEGAAPDLGLVVALEIVRGHGGNAEIQGGRGLGAIAKISLPRPAV